MTVMTQARLLRQLASLNGIQIAYYDVDHKRQVASHESLLSVLRLLGTPVYSLSDVPSALREYNQARWKQLIEPVIVAWDGNASPVEIRLPYHKDFHLRCQLQFDTRLSQEAPATLSPCGIHPEGFFLKERAKVRGRFHPNPVSCTGQALTSPIEGEELLNDSFAGSFDTQVQREWEVHTSSIPDIEVAEVEGNRYVKKHLHLPSGLPYGYHRLIIEIAGKSEEAIIISAPLKAYLPPQQHDWGVFLPLYALHQNGWGCGSYSDLAELSSWVSDIGGGVLATLPFLPVFLDRLFDPSPYSPLSRLMWNEFYIDVTKVPELQTCPPAQAILASSEFERELEDVRRLPTVDYRRLMTIKRKVLEQLCRCLFSGDSPSLDELRRFVAGHPLVENYARFRAACERQGKPWQSWPQSMQKGIKEGDYDKESMRYHLYAQWLAHQQVESVAQTADKKCCKLFVDLPLGSHPDGFDTWYWQDLFVNECSVGAPPDAVFTNGQDWSFPPQHPEKCRRQGYSYFIESLRHHLRHAGILRIDHMMGFHRLFWIPKGMEASQGVYVRYPAEELYALLTLESHRHNALVVGEDLGTVPPEVRPAMARHGLCRTYVVQYELESDSKHPLPAIPTNTAVSLNTHDMPTFAAYWQGLDLKLRAELGLIRRSQIPWAIKRRDKVKSALVRFLQSKGLLDASRITDILRAILGFLSASRARVLLVNLEDLWQEIEPQNVPGLRDKRYWSRKTRYTFEEFSQMPDVIDVLRQVNRLRKR